MGISDIIVIFSISKKKLMKLFLITIGLFASVSIFAQEVEGIRFILADLTKAQVQATNADKIIFVDAYTTWCGPCKMMDRTTFKDEEVAKFYNDNFVNLKMDMEKGKGPTFAQKHSVRGYPSLLFLNARGDLVHRSLGFQDEKRFLKLGQSASDPSQQVITLQNRFESGEKDQKFLLNYADALTMAGMSGYDEATQAYIEQEKNWNTSKNIKVLFDYSKASIDSKLFQYMIANKDLFEAEIGMQKVEDKISFAASSDVRSKQVDTTDKEALTTHFAKYFGVDHANERATRYYLNNLMYSPGEINEQKYLADVQLFMASNPVLSFKSLNAHAWRIYELSDDRLLLAQAESWINKSIEQEKNSFNLDTKASILYKLGKKKEALKAAEESVKLAGEEGSDPSATEELISKIKAM